MSDLLIYSLKFKTGGQFCVPITVAEFPGRHHYPAFNFRTMPSGKLLCIEMVTAIVLSSRDSGLLFPNRIFECQKYKRENYWTLAHYGLSSVLYWLWSIVYFLLYIVYFLWYIVYCEQSIVYCLWSIVYGLFSMVWCLLFMVCCLLFMVCCLWSFVYGLWSIFYCLFLL